MKLASFVASVRKNIKAKHMPAGLSQAWEHPFLEP